MTVLLIDKSGHKRVYEITSDHAFTLRSILVPIPRPVCVEVEMVRPTRLELSVAEFKPTDELSWPSVYRQV